MLDRRILTGAFAGLVLLFASGLPASAVPRSEGQGAETAPRQIPNAQNCTPIRTYKILPGDIVMGSKTAPITIIEYASITCPHCAHLHQTVLPLVKQHYIDTGFVRFVYRDFPLDQVAFAASVLTRCVSKKAYHPFLNDLFATQAKWATSSDVRASLQDVSARAGLNQAAFEACLQKKPVVEAVMKSRDEGLKNYCIAGTPTTIMNGRVLPNPDAGDFERLDGILRAELRKLGKLPPPEIPKPPQR